MTATPEPMGKLDAATVVVANGPKDAILVWRAVDWRAAEGNVRRLRQRIFTASQAGDLKKVRNLQKLMLRSRANTLVSVRRVTERNAGRKTAGVDGQVVLSPEAKMELAEWVQRSSEPWHARPLKRVYIPKRGSAKRRPLGIPVIVDRVLQARALNALEPEWEARFEPRSYGFRPGRGCQDAVSAIYLTLNGKNPQRRWVLDADLAAAFDRIDHNHLLAMLGTFPARGLVVQWLKAGVIENGRFAPTEEGTPQGGVMTAPTQLVTRWFVARPAVGGRDRVADRDLVVVAADQYFADDEPQDALLSCGSVVEPVGEAAEEALEGVGELEVGLGVVELGVERVELCAQGGLPLAQLGGPGAELVERDQLFLVGLDQASDRGVGACDVALERLAAARGGMLGPQRGESAVDLGSDELRVLEQPSDLAPDERVELIGADRAAVAPLAVGVPPAVLADAAVVVDPLVARARRGAVAGVAALAADEDPLQQRQLLGVAPGEVRVLAQSRLRELERLLGDHRRDRDERPLLGRLVGAGEPAAVALTALAGGARRSAVALRVLVFPNAACPR